MPASTVADVNTLMRKLLGDTLPSTGDLYTDTYNLEYIQSAYRYVARELCTAGVTLFRKQTASWVLPEGVTAAWYARVGTPFFTGAGVDDLTFGGNYTGAAVGTFLVEIDLQGTPDTFEWSFNGTVGASGVAITGSAQTLSNGVTITFATTTGHTLANSWTGVLLPSDFLRPIMLREVAGDNELIQTNGFIPELAQTATLQGAYDWYDNAIWFIGATGDVTLQMQYEPQLPTVTATTDLIKIPDGLDAVTNKACALAAAARGQNNDVKTFIDDADQAMRYIIQSESKAQSPVGTQMGRGN
ncbi:MAG: hypothetical protein IPK52_22000 [Chloroflexi bacterium]|nr:hypothetical protein [Chloroflexota bacterium]